MKNKHRGFTVEIVVSLMILAGILFIVVKLMSDSPEAKKTKIVLNTLQGMINEFQLQGGKMETLADQYTLLGNEEIMPNGVMLDDFANSNGQFNAPLQRTRNVMLVLGKVPKNIATLDKLPPEVFLRDPVTKKLLPGPILLDGWNRPFLFAPGRTSKGPGNVNWGIKGMIGRNSSFHPRDGNGMFISAGANMDFSKGDDNLYSVDK